MKMARPCNLLFVVNVGREIDLFGLVIVELH